MDKIACLVRAEHVLNPLLVEQLMDVMRKSARIVFTDKYNDTQLHINNNYRYRQCKFTAPDF